MNRKVIVFAIFLSLAACKTEEEKSRSEGYVPPSQQCTTNTEPDCVGSAAALVSVPLPEGHNKGLPAAKITGECEMLVAGEKKARPCKDIQLVVRASRENEVREAVFDGDTFRFEDLNHSVYDLEATSPKYDVLSDTKTLNTGQNVKIRVKVKPRQ